MGARWLRGFAVGVFVCAGGAASAGSHLWVINEAFSNADGTIQFIEMYNCCAANEIGLLNKIVTSSHNGIMYTFQASLRPDSTTDKYILLATQAFANLPGAPPPDHVIPANAFAIGGDLIQWDIYPASIMSFGAGQLPTDGVRSLNRPTTGPLVVAASTPTNFAGQKWKPPGVTGLNVQKSLADGSRLRLGYETTDCNGHVNHQILHGVASQLPGSLGGTYDLSGAQCNIGAASPYNWVGVPSDPVLGGFVWFLIQATNGAATEGSWGWDSNGNERNGPAAGGASGLCGMTAKELANTCGR